MPEEVRADLLLGRDTLSPGLVKAGKAASDASGNVRQLTRDLYEVGKQRATPIVDLQDTAATAKLDEVSAKLKELGAKVADPGIDVNDKDAVAKVAAMRVKLDQLGSRVSSPRVTLDGLGRAEAQILALDAQLDKLDGRHVDVTVDVNRSLGSRLAGLFGGGGGAGGAASGASGAAGPLAGGLFGNPVGQGALIGGGLIALGSVPGLVGLGLGGGVGLGAIAGGTLGAAQGNKILKADTANITQITTALKTAIGQQKTQLSAALKAANAQYAKDSVFYAPFIAFQKSLSDLAQNFLKPLRPIMAPLTQIIGQFGKGIAQLGPQFTALFKASLPFIQQFAQVMLTSGKILLPAFTQALNTMVKSGALKEMTQGLVYVIQGIAGFVNALGPGMKASGQIFERVGLAVKGTLIVIGKTVSVVANVMELNWGAAVKRMWHDTVTAFDSMRHDISAIFDEIRHSIAAEWDTIWNTTVARVKSGISDVVGWFRGIPSRALGALTGLGHSLYAFAHSALNELWSGFKSVAGSIISWIKGFGSSIISGLKHLFGIHSPSSVFHGIGENLMKGLLNGLKAGHGPVGGFLSNVSGQLLGGVTGAFSHSAAVAQKYASALLAQYGWSQRQMASLIPLWNQESGWNAYAVNPTSGAYGIPQSLGHGHPYALGDYKNQVIWGLNYIRQRYGSPSAAWAHEQAFNWYGSGLQGGLFSKPTLIGVGERGPERVDITPVGSPRRGGGQRIELVIRTGNGATNLDRAIVEIVRRAVTVSGGGDVQRAFGQGT